MRRRRRRGAVLIEVVVAISLFAVAALAVLGAVAQGRESVARGELRVRAADLARSVMSLIEAGVLAPEAASGPAPAWDGQSVDVEGSSALLDAFAELSGSRGLDERGWMVDVALEPTEFDGLTLVEVRASLVLGSDPEDAEARAVLRQFVRLDPPADDSVGTVADLFPGDAGAEGFESRAERLDRGNRFDRDASRFERDASRFDRDASRFDRDMSSFERDDPFADRPDPFAERAERLRRDDPGGGGR